MTKEENSFLAAMGLLTYQRILLKKKDYSVIEKIIITEKTVYLYTSAINAYIINSDFFKDENEKSDFRDYIISKAINAQIIKK